MRVDSEQRCGLHTLVAYADQFPTNAAFKRLGFLEKRGSGGDTLVDACRERLTQGYSKPYSSLTNMSI